MTLFSFLLNHNKAKDKRRGEVYMKYYTVISKDEAFIMNKEEWKKFSQNHKGFHAVRYNTKEEAEEEIEKVKKLITYKEELKPVSSKYLCFYDSEFNATDYDDGLPQEVVSIGIVIADRDGNFVDEYYSTIRLKAAKKVNHRCQKITGLTTKEIAKSPAFYTVCSEIDRFISKYKIGTIYALGKDDLSQFKITANLYNRTKAMGRIESKIVNIRRIFRELTNQEIADLGLHNLKQICGIDGEVKHNALQDAKDLANVYYELKTKGYSETIYKEILKERNNKRLYEKSRNVLDNEGIVAPTEIINARDMIINFLEDNKPSINEIVLKAIIDDLKALMR